MTDTLIPDREQAASELADLRLRTDLFIDGDFRPARDGRRFVTENPATGQSITEEYIVLAVRVPGYQIGRLTVEHHEASVTRERCTHTAGIPPDAVRTDADTFEVLRSRRKTAQDEHQH